MAGRGKRLHTHQMHIRRTANKGYIARHELVDDQGNPPDDGQSPEAEYSLPDHAALMAHVQDHMGPQEPQEPPDEGPEPPEPGEPGE